MSLEPGSTLGHYEILDSLGTGGMGEVYRARDPSLEREVAIKVLPEAFAENTERLSRFEREAKALAALNHPNIATVHGFEQEGGEHFLVMELVEGEDLAERIARGPIPVEEAIPFFIQIAEGLEAAHGRGIVHRDLKPGNIKVGPDGRVKILDFGLAKVLEPAAADDNLDLSQSPTRTAAMTARGEIMGTAGYMSPEQARGGDVDERADIWAFGVCLYESLVGDHPFRGETVEDTLAAVLRADVDRQTLASRVPAWATRLLQKTLARDLRSRMHSIADARIELEAAQLEGEEQVVVAAGPPRGGRVVLLAVATAAVVAGILGLMVGRFSFTADSVGDGVRTTRAPIALPDVELVYDFYPTLALSPDGRRLAFVGFDRSSTNTFLLDLETSTEPRRFDWAFAPFFSHDGEWLGYSLENQLRAVPVNGGEHRVLVDVGGYLVSDASWGVDGSVWYSADSPGGLRRLAPEDGVVEFAVEAPEGHSYRYPRPLPGGKHILISWRRQRETGEEESDIAVLPVAGGEPVVLRRGGFYPRYVASGHVVFAERDSILAMPFDPETLDVGEPRLVVEDVVTHSTDGYALFDVSEAGDLVYLTGSSERSREIVRLRPGGDPEVLTQVPDAYVYSRLRADPTGTRAVLSRNGPRGSDVVILDLASGEIDRRVTDRPGYDAWPTWAPDGRVTWSSTRDGGSVALSRDPLDLTAEPELVVRAEERTVHPGDWSPDGRTLVYDEYRAETGGDILAVSTSGERSEVVATPYNDINPALSPDGRWLAWTSDETGPNDFRIYIAPFPGGGAKREVSVGGVGGICVRWAADGTRLYYSWGSRVFVVEVDTSSGLEMSAPELYVDSSTAWRQTTSRGVGSNGAWDVLADGSIITVRRWDPLRMVLVQNWGAELKRLVPVE